MITIENPDEIYKWNIKELWACIQLLEPEQEQLYEEEIRKAKYGQKIKIPIIYIMKNWTTENPENKRISIKGYGKYNILDYYDEIEEREKILRRIIFEAIEEEEITRPRT